jgi:CubicO group peptidase (beta-lactamase class C family)
MGKTVFCWLVSVAVLASTAPAAPPPPISGADVRSEVDPQALAETFTAFADIDGAWAMVVVWRGEVVGETYPVGSAQTLYPIWSVTKSLTSTAVGIAIDDGVFANVDARLVDHLPQHLVPAEPIKGLITLEHLLLMTSGLGWSEDLDWLDWIASPHPASFILDRELTSWPGSEFNYSSASSHLPSLMVETTAGEGLEALTDRELFAPLGIVDWQWEEDPQDYAYGGHGVHLKTRDLARLGVLFLHRGRSDGIQVVPEQWVARATEPRFGWGDAYGVLQDLDYGYLWWTAEVSGMPIFLAWGWGGQFVFCVPDLDLVVATAADGDVWADQAATQELAILEVVATILVPGVPSAEVFRDGFESGVLAAWTGSEPG